MLDFRAFIIAKSILIKRQINGLEGVASFFDVVNLIIEVTLDALPHQPAELFVYFDQEDSFLLFTLWRSMAQFFHRAFRLFELVVDLVGNDGIALLADVIQERNELVAQAHNAKEIRSILNFCGKWLSQLEELNLVVSGFLDGHTIFDVLGGSIL